MANAPMLSPEWQITGAILEYKPYPGYPDWVVAWDLTPMFTAVQEYINGLVQTEVDRATAAESALDARITALENP